MKWSEFVDGCDIWPDNVITNNIEHIDTFGDGSDVAESLIMLPDKTACDRLVNRALEAGVCFSISDVMEMDGYISDKLRDMLIYAYINKQPILSYSDLEYLMEILDEKEFSAVIMQQINNGAKFSSEHILKMVTCGYVNEHTTNKLVLEYAKAGNAFKMDEIKELVDYILESVLGTVLMVRLDMIGGISYDELIYFADYLSEESLVYLFFGSAQRGIRFTVDQLSELDCYVSAETLVKIVKEKNPNIKKSDIRKLKEIISLSTVYEMLYN